MSYWGTSLTGRVWAESGRRLGSFWQASFIGRGLGRVGGAGRSVAGGSAVLSPETARSGSLSPGSSAVASRLVALAYMLLVRWFGEGWLGRTARRIGRAASTSVLASGAWWRVLGAAMVGGGLGSVVRLVVDSDAGSAPAALAASCAVLVAGVLMVTVGPRLGVAAGSGAVAWVRRRLAGRATDPLPTSVPASPVWSPRLIAACLGALAVAALAGAAAGPTPLIAIALVVAGCAVVVLPYRAELLLVVLAAFPWVDWSARRSLGGLGGVWNEFLVLASFCCLLWVTVVVRRWDLRSVPLVLPLGAAFVAAVASLVYREVDTHVAVFALQITFKPLLFYFLGFLLPRDRRVVRWVVVVFLAASLVLAIHGLYQYVSHAPMPAKWVDAHEATIGTRAYSIIENPNGLGAFLLMGMLLSVSLALARLPLGQRVLAAATAVVLGAGIAVTFSRGAWLGLVVGLVALLALSRWRLLAGLAVAALALVAVAPRTFVSRFTFAFSNEYIAKSRTSGRLLMWEAAQRHVVWNPWTGLGLGTFGGTSAFLYGYSVLWVDNFYLQMASEGGLLLLAAFLWLLVRAGKGLVLAHREQADPFLKAVAAGVFGAFVAVCFANLTASVFETVAVGGCFWFLVGLASAPLDAASRLSRVGHLQVEVRGGRLAGEGVADGR